MVGENHSFCSMNPRFIQPTKTRLSSAGLTVIDFKSNWRLFDVLIELGWHREREPSSLDIILG